MSMAWVYVRSNELKVCITTVITWVKQVSKLTTGPHEPETIPDELDELETFVGSKKNKIWLWTAVDHFKPES